MDFANSLRDAMRSHAFTFYGHLDLTPHKYHFFNSSGTSCRKNCCRYRVYEGNLGAHLHCWRRDIDVQWFYKDGKYSKPLSHLKKILIKKEQEYSKALREKEISEGINNAQKEWLNSKDLDPDLPYVIRKRIIPYYARQIDNLILIPIYDKFGQIVSNQKIYSDGSKRFARNAPIKGNYLIIGEIITDTILFCEGWATGCSIYEAADQMTIVCLQASNIPDVAQFFRQRLSDHRFIFCADIDKNKEKVGEKYAKISSDLTNGKIIFPQFKEGDKGSDFNDMACLYGQATLVTFFENIFKTQQN